MQFPVTKLSHTRVVRSEPHMKLTDLMAHMDFLAPYVICSFIVVVVLLAVVVIMFSLSMFRMH